MRSQIAFRSWTRSRPSLPTHDVRSVLRLLLTGLLVLAAMGTFQSSLAQQQETQEEMYRIETVDGNVVVGTLISQDDEEVVLDAQQLGEVTIARSDIQSMEEIQPDRTEDGEYWFPNPQSTRYFFAPNAMGIPNGQGYYQNTWVLLNNVNFAVSKNFSLGFGMVPVFLFGANAFPIWVLPKASVSVPGQNLHFAGGAVLGGVLAEDGEAVGVVYGSSTVGTRDRNATVGVGYGYTGQGFADAPIINVNGMTRVGRTTYLISENYFFPSSDFNGVVSFGLRWAPENFAVDFGLVRPLEDTDNFVALPWLGVTIPFGQ